MCGIAISFWLKEQLIISCPLLALDGSSLFTKSCQVSLARYIPTPRKIKRSLRLVMECVSTNSHLPCIFGYVWLSSIIKTCNQDTLNILKRLAPLLKTIARRWSRFLPSNIMRPSLQCCVAQNCPKSVPRTSDEFQCRMCWVAENRFLD